MTKLFAFAFAFSRNVNKPGDVAKAPTAPVALRDKDLAQVGGGLPVRGW